MVHAARRRLEVRAAIAAELILGRNGAPREGAALADVPGILEAPVSAVARAMFVAALPHVPPRLSEKRQEQLEAAARRIDHYGQPGDWIRVALSVLQSWRAGELAGWVSGPPRSLGALALELRREANLRRHGALERRTERLRPLADARRRQAVKRWRRDIREHAHDYPGLRPGGLLRKPWREGS